MHILLQWEFLMNYYPSEIAGIEVYLPEQVLDNEDLAKEYTNWSSSKIEKKVGITKRHIAANGQTAGDLAFEVIKSFLNNHDIGKNDIEFLTLCTQSPDYFLPTTACILQDRLGLSTSCGAIDFNQGCSGFIYGLALAKGLIASGLINNMLLVTADTYSKFINKNDRSTRAIFGDGATCTLIQKSDSDKIHYFLFGTDGSGANNLIVPLGGMRNRTGPVRSIKDDRGNLVRTNCDLYMNGPEIFNFSLKVVPEAINTFFKKYLLSYENIDYYIFHQANKYMLMHLRDKIGIPEDKFYLDLRDTGNTVSCTIPIALKNSIERGYVKKGDKVLLVGFGVGYSWGVTLITA